MSRVAGHSEERVAAIALVGVLVLARVFGLAGRDLPLSIWTPSVLIWHDVAVGFAFWVIALALGWSWPTKSIYWLIVCWVAINVAVVRTLSSPLTVSMLRATGGALGDSIGHQATPANLTMVGAVVAAGWLLPRVRLPMRAARVTGVALLVVALPGPLVGWQVDARGAQQNAVTALLSSALRRAPAPVAADIRDWRESPFGGAEADDLTWLKGAAAGRSVVMIVLESTGARYLRTYGAADDPMPTLTALARQAIQFDSAYAVYPESIKGLFSVLCSRHSALDIAVEVHARAACSPLVQELSRTGYQTGLFHSGRFSYLGMEAVVNRQAFDVREDAGAIGGVVESSFGVDEPSTVARILSWIDGLDRARPFFVAYLPVAGHHPYNVPVRGPFAGDGDLSAYKNALHFGDASLATLLAGLESRGLDGQVMLVVFGDHGEAFGQHDGNFGHTLFAFDENVRVPLLVAIPGVTTRATRARQVASLIDVAPTVLELLGLRPPDDYEGRSLLAGRSRMAYFFTDYALRWAGLRDGCWKYLLEIDAGRPRLFDVCADPGESRNEAARHPDRVAAYRHRALGWLAATLRSYEGR
jgi:hypothetical protein